MLQSAIQPSLSSSSRWTKRINGFVKAYDHKNDQEPSITWESRAESKAFCMKMARKLNGLCSKSVQPAKEQVVLSQGEEELIRKRARVLQIGVS